MIGLYKPTGITPADSLISAKSNPCFIIFCYLFRPFIDKLIRFFFISTPITRTSTISPTLTASRGCLINLSVISEMCTRPSWCTPISTNAPKSMTLRTVPFSLSSPEHQSEGSVSACHHADHGPVSPVLSRYREV